ncbi:HD domain-containing phosphohydrolase [Desulfuromonas versatilis]|uniref:HD domain-containing phosphohydrolase n=1 Tax=Desulfuromonas versatilis TaxID=2802975 RepID=UPI001C8616BF|nr:HD domain-containing phosphohydrolase [Desulfuromonas versatilis]
MDDSQRILVVDDNETVCLLLSELLGDEGYQVTTVTCGGEALEAFCREPFPLVLLDLVLPDMSGTRVLEEIKRSHPQTDAVLITSHGSMETAVEALRLGAADYLTKPFADLGAVSALVRTTFEKRREKELKAQQAEALARRAEQLETAVKRLMGLARINQALNAARDARELQEAAVRFVAAELDAQRVSMMLLDREAGDLEIVASVGLQPFPPEAGRVRLGEGVAGLVAEKGWALRYCTRDPNPGIPTNVHRGYQADAFVSVPLLEADSGGAGRLAMGVLNACNRVNREPFSAEDEEFLATVADQLVLRLNAAHAASREVRESTYQAVLAFAEALDAKDHTTGEHADGMLKFVEPVGRALDLNWQELEILLFGAVLHDIGKIGVPEVILQKPSRLTEEEFAVMKEHCRKGGDIIRGMTFLAPVIPVIEMHHERFDGQGYPFGKAGEQIPVQARIVAVLDAYDAMMADRPYRKGIGKAAAVAELRRGAGSQFDPQVVEAFLKILNAGEQ